MAGTGRRPEPPGGSRHDSGFHQGQSGGRGTGSPRPAYGPGQGPAPALPPKCVFDSFYEGSHLRRGVYLDGAQEITKICMQEGLTASQLRQLFFLLKSVEQRLRVQPDLDFGFVKEELWKFMRQVEYQVKRGVLKSSTFAALVGKHLDVASKDAREFRGFVEYLTSIVAYLKEK